MAEPVWSPALLLPNSGSLFCICIRLVLGHKCRDGSRSPTDLRGNILTMKKSDRSRYFLYDPFRRSGICSLLCILLCNYLGFSLSFGSFCKFLTSFYSTPHTSSLTVSFEQGEKKLFLNYTLAQRASLHKAAYSYSQFDSILKCLEYSILS